MVEVVFFFWLRLQKQLLLQGIPPRRQLFLPPKMHILEEDKHCLSDQVGQMQSKLDKAALHRDLIRVVGMELQKMNPRVDGYQNGQVLYKQPPETPDERRFRIFGTHEYIGCGPYGKDGLWIQWSKPFKAPTHAEVQAFLKERDRWIAASKSRR